MGLIDPGILFQQNPGALADGAKQTMGLMAGMQQMRGQREQRQNAQADRSRAEQAREAFAKSAQGEDITSPDGMKRTIAKFAQAGFPQEAAAVLDAHKEMFPVTKPVPAKWGAIPGTGTLFDESTGTTKASGADPLKPTPDKEWDPLGPAKLEEDKRHNRAMEAKAAFEAKKAAAAAGATKLTEAQSKTLGAAGMAKTMLDDIANQFKDSRLGGASGFAADVVESIPLIGGKLAPKTNEFNDKRRITAETFLREATGAAAPAAEIKFYTRLLPEAGDSPEQAQSALNAFRGAVMAKVKGVAATLRAQGKDDQAAQIESKMQGLFDTSVNIKDSAPDNIAKPKTKAERDALPPGTKYIGPDGKTATKQ
jgi:hypothetical protein